MKSFQQRIKEALIEMRAMHTKEDSTLMRECATIEEATSILDAKYVEILSRHFYLYQELESLFHMIDSADCLAQVRQSSLFKKIIHHQHLETQEITQADSDQQT